MHNEDKIFKIIHIMILGLAVIICFYALYMLGDSNIDITILIVCILLTGTVRHILNKTGHGGIIRFILPYPELVMISILAGQNSFALSLIVLIVWDVAVDYEAGYTTVFGIFSYISYMFIYMKLSQSPSILNTVILLVIAAIQFLLFAGFAVFMKKYRIAADQLSKASSELMARNIVDRENSLIMERNRISGQIHDTVGHRLTTALIQAEAVELLIQKRPDEALQKLEIVKEELKGSLQDIRKAVNFINRDDEYEDFSLAVRNLIIKVKEAGLVDVIFEIDDISSCKLLIKKFFYHVILEAVTNAIKHGRCKRISIKLINKGNFMELSCFNDGLIPEEITDGYGFERIKDKTAGFKGNFMLKKNKEGWFGIVVNIPVET